MYIYIYIYIYLYTHKPVPVQLVLDVVPQVTSCWVPPVEARRKETAWVKLERPAREHPEQCHLPIVPARDPKQCGHFTRAILCGNLEENAGRVIETTSIKHLALTLTVRTQCGHTVWGMKRNLVDCSNKKK